MANLKDIEGIGDAFAATLAGAGLTTTDDLLREAGSASGRRTLAGKVNLPESRILDWVNRADLMRIRGVGSEYSDLLEAAGVDTVRELGTRVPANLHARLVEVNDQRQLVRRAPTVTEVETWITEAKTLPAMVSY